MSGPELHAFRVEIARRLPEFVNQAAAAARDVCVQTKGRRAGGNAETATNGK